MYDEYAQQLVMAILLAMTGLAVGLLFHSSPAALFFAIVIAVVAVLICPSPP